MEHTQQITCHDGTIVLGFQGGWCFLANTHRTPFTRLGQRYQSVHQYMEASKAMFFDDEQTYEEIMKEKTCKGQSEWVPHIKGYDYNKWSEVEEKYLRMALVEKLRQHPKIMDALVGTKDAIIANCTCFDNVDGTGLKINSVLMKEKKMWGRNRLGRLLMEYRKNGLPVKPTTTASV